MHLVKFFLKSDFWVVEQCSATHFVSVENFSGLVRGLLIKLFSKSFRSQGRAALVAFRRKRNNLGVSFG